MAARIRSASVIFCWKMPPRLRESFTTASLVAEAFKAGGLERRESLDHLAEFFAAHPGQSGVRERFRDPGPLGWGVVVVQEIAQLCGGGEPHGGGGDRDLLLGKQLASLGDPIADREVADLEHVRKDLLGADLAEVDDCDQHSVRVGEQAVGPGALGAAAFAAAQRRWRAVNGAHLVALVRAGATFIDGKLVERPTESPVPTAA